MYQIDSGVSVILPHSMKYQKNIDTSLAMSTNYDSIVVFTVLTCDRPN